MRKTAVFVFGSILLAASLAGAGDYFTKDKGGAARGEQKQDMALVYFFRPATMGAAIKTWGFADDQLIGLSKSKGYYFGYVSPGKHIFWSKAENTSALELEVEAGRTYYFKQEIKLGFNKARVHLIQIDEGEAEKYFSKCSPTTPTEEGRQRAIEIAANRGDRAEDKAAKRTSKKQGKEEK